MSSPDSKEINLVRCIKCGKILKCSRYDTAALLKHIRTDHPEVDIVDVDSRQKRTTGTEINNSLVQHSENSRQDDQIDDCQSADDFCDIEKCRPYGREQHVSYENTEDEEKEKDRRRPRQPQYVKDVDLTRYSATSEILEKYPEIKECEYSPHNPNAQVVYTRRYKVNAAAPVSTSALQQPFQGSLYRASIEKWCPANGTIFCPKCGANKRPLIKTKTERFTYNQWCGCCLLSCWPFCFIPWILPGQNIEYLHCANCKIFLGLYDSNTNCIRPNRLYVSSDENSHTTDQAKNNRHYVEDNKLLENESPPRSQAGESANSKQISSIIVNGKELPPETVERIRNLKRYSSFVGLDMDELTNPTDSPKSTKRNGNRKGNKDAATSVAKENR